MRPILILMTMLALVTPGSSAPSASGIRGTVLFLEGDFMPGPGPKSGTTRPVIRKVLVYAAARLDQVKPAGEGGFYSRIDTPLVAQTTSAKNGKFEVKVAPGTYTLVVEENGQFYANGTDGTYLKPVVVEKGKFTDFQFNIDYKSTW